MPGATISVKSTDGGAFDSYLALPDDTRQAPAVVLASSIDGVDADLREIAHAFGAAGYIVAAPDLFWRTFPGPLPDGDPRTLERAQPRLQRLAENEQDLVDTRAFLETLPMWNGRAAVMGFCYGGPFAIVGPKRLGFMAGMSCHGSQMLDFVDDVPELTAPVSIIWGDQDHRAPAEVLEAYRAAAAESPYVQVHILPGIEHGFMMPSAAEFDAPARDFSMQTVLTMLSHLRD